ncbi:T9SS type B sorting domain-containing protein [Costertonia aggregata]|uniref:T9SS type B sorting domain-containing protein n=1 Tax=Costertonia aggregata TaxID=343403 RepID=A0A7H9ATG8_9FLAO|nr:T9SS type B sorting domain-containing protein [Costertonia aggregata]QLG46783.1 T9SS type B sorting domain-containing protein [Costertonia aggregata]
MRNYFLVLFLLLSSFFSHAQKEAAVWYFGENAGLDFNTGAPVVLLDGQIRTQEGCSVISDFNGNLLFYTDGVTVWDRNHDQMPNGTGLNGHPSSTQSGIIVPAPGNLDIYYVFTVDELADVEGLQYSIVDLTLNGGLGDITVKNVLLETPVLEKLTAVAHANGTDIWVVAHRNFGNEYIAYLVTTAGVSVSPIVSAIGLPATEQRHVGGYLKFSPDGNFLASAASKGNFLQLFRFNNATGVISDFLEFESFYNGIAGTRIMGNYGLAFSSDSSKLYVQSTIYFNYPNLNSRIYQFDLSNYDATSIEASATLVASQSVEIGALQLAIDGKIYATQFNQYYLGVINNPNVGGTGSGYVENGVSLGSRRSRLGLPPFIQTYFIVGLRANNFCLGDSTEFSVTTNEPITSITWDFGDGTTSNLENPTHIYANSGIYTVSVTAATASETKTEVKDITIYETPMANIISDIEVCSTTTSIELDLSLKDSEILGTQSPSDYEVTYHSRQIDAENGVLAIPNTYTTTSLNQTIYARIYNRNNTSCYDTNSFIITVKQAPELLAISDWTVCDDDTDGFFDFDLSTKDSEILGAQDASIFNISYHGSQTDADAGTAPLGLSYTNSNPSEQVFFRIENATFTECFKTGNFAVEVIPGVTANSVSAISVCDDDNDGFSVFDLTVKNPEILGTQDASSFTVTYHITQFDADNGMDAVTASSFTNTIPYDQTMYARIRNNSSTDCYDTISFDISINDSPVLQNVTDWNVCDDNNDTIYGFDLTEKNMEILGAQSALDFTVSFYENRVEAETGANPIVGIWNNTAKTQEVFYRLTSVANPVCFVVDSFIIRVKDIPEANAPTPFIVCDTEETGRQIFDLTSKDIEILGPQNPSQFEVFYFASETDALLLESPLPKTNYSNTLLTETLYARIQNIDYGECYKTVPLELIVNPLPQINIEDSYVICPDSPELIIDAGNFETWSWRNESGIEIGTGRNLDIIEIGEYSLAITQTNNGLTCENIKSFEVFSSGAPESLEIEIGEFSDKVDISLNVNGTGEFEYSMDGIVFQTDNRFEVFPGEYNFFARDIFLCRTISKTVTALGYEKFFTPNGDMSHEHWNIIGGDRYPDSVVSIYDRYGSLLHQLSPTSVGWDGTFNGRPLPASDYWFRYEYDNGKVFTGHFTLKR